MNAVTEFSTPILKKASQYAKEIYKESAFDSLPYHDLEHTEEVVKACLLIGEEEGLDNDEMEVLLIAAWFHDTGHKEENKNHEELSAEIAAKFLEEEQFESSKIKEVKKAILATRMPQSPTTKLGNILCDADLFHLSTDNFNKRSEALRKEWESMGNKMTNVDWCKQNIEFLRQHSFFTNYGKEVLSPKKEKNLKKSEKKYKKLKKEEDNYLSKELDVNLDELKALKKKLSKVQGKPERGIETMFRTTSKNHVEFSAMADSKANIIISVNSIIITIIIGVLLRKLDSNPHLTIPTFILLVVCLVAIVFAILATRPNITSGKFTKDDIINKKANLLFFGNFHKMQLPDFKWGMEEMLNDSDYLYGSMIKDIYFLGVVLGKKYNYLRVSYTVFMWGLIVSTVAFMIATMISGGGDAPFIDDDLF